MPAPCIRLVEITLENLTAVLNLAVSPAQQNFVASNARSLAQAHYHPEAWPRALATGDPAGDATGTSFVGFVMLDVQAGPDTIYLWRLMIDAAHQRSGYGRGAMAAIVAHVRTLPGITRLLLSFVDAPGSPEPFYARLGFIRTGNCIDGEEEMLLTL